MVPLPVILVEFVVALGLALAAGNGVALWRARREPIGPVRPARSRPGGGVSGAAPARVSRGRAYAGVVIGTMMVLWGVATFVANDYSL